MHILPNKRYFCGTCICPMHAVSHSIIQTRVYHIRRDSIVNVNVIESYEFITLQTVLQVFLSDLHCV